MSESPLLNTSINSGNTRTVNPEAHTSRQLLNRHSPDEDDEDDVDEEEDDEGQIGGEEIEDEEEEEEEIGGEEIEEDNEENGDDILVTKVNNEHVNNSFSSIPSSSSPSRPFEPGWGRGSRPMSIVIIFLLFFPKKISYLKFRPHPMQRLLRNTEM